MKPTHFVPFSEAPSWPVYGHRTLSSTQTEAEEMLRNNHPAPFVVMAECQTQGRGQWDRVWHSPVGHLYASIVLFASPWPQPLGHAALVGGLAVLKTIVHLMQEHTKPDPQPAITLKWPNDVLIDERKVAGLLCEMYDTHHMIMGMGVNLAALGTNHPPDATSLHTYGVSCTPLQFLHVCVPLLQKHLQNWLTQGSDPLLHDCAAWGARAESG